jgi:hypothetical protein
MMQWRADYLDAAEVKAMQGDKLLPRCRRPGCCSALFPKTAQIVEPALHG